MNRAGVPSLPSLVVLLGLVAIGVAAACDQDPVHDNEVSALGPESPGVPTGPDHRPGQPCLVCHGGSGPASAQFAVGGTVYVSQSGADVPLSGAMVTVTDTTSSAATGTTNEVGNFWVLQAQWAPVFPVHVAVSYSGSSTEMFTHIGRDGSCADCHYDPRGGSAVGHVYFVPGEYPDGGFGEGGI